MLTLILLDYGAMYMIKPAKTLNKQENTTSGGFTMYKYF